MKIKRHLCGVTAFILMNACPAWGFILNDTFDDGDRTIQNPPESLAYFTSQESTSLTEANGMLTLYGNSNRFLLAAVGEVGEYITLNDGEAVSLEMTFKVEGRKVSNNRSLRIGWFNSSEKPGDTRLLDRDRFGARTSMAEGCRGYQAALGLWPPMDNPISLHKRVRQHDDLLFVLTPGAGAYALLGAGGVGQVNDDGLNTLQFYIRRIGDAVEVGVIFVPGGPAAGDETSFFYKLMDHRDPIFNFDYFAIGLNADDGSVDRLDIETLRIFKVQ